MTLRFKSVVLILVVAALVCLAIWWARERLESWTQVPGEYSLNHGSLGTAQDISLEDASKECEKNPECKGFVFAPTLKGQQGMAFYKSEIRMDAKSPYALYNSFTVCKEGVDCGPGAKEMTRMKIPGSTVEFDLKSLTGQLAGPDPDPKQPGPDPKQPGPGPKQPGPDPKQPGQPPLPNQPPAVTPIPIVPDQPPVVASGVLDFHNQVRARHGANPLAWSDAVAASAQAWANGCVWGHPGGHPYGENIAGGHANLVEAAQAWYNEVDAVRGVAQFPDLYYDAGGHFTAMVWKGTTELGCGTAACPGGLYHVCRYNPPGNMQGAYRDNVSV